MLQRISVLIVYNVALGVFYLFPNDASSEIYIILLLREIGKFIHIVVEHALRFVLHAWSILVELAHEHAVSSLCILICTMSFEIFLHLSAAIELVGSSQVTAFHLHEDGLRIDETALVEIEVDSSTQEFFCEHRYIEVVGIVACEIATCKFLL